MRFRNGMARLTIVGVVIVELMLAGGTYHAWTELNEAKQQLASLPPPIASTDEASSATLNEMSPEEIVRSAAEDSARSDYEYTAATVETKKSALYLFLGSLVAFPLIAAVIFQTLFWIGRGFRKQPA
jgi:hypothetical protein